MEHEEVRRPFEEGGEGSWERWMMMEGWKNSVAACVGIRSLSCWSPSPLPVTKVSWHHSCMHPFPSIPSHPTHQLPCLRWVTTSNLPPIGGRLFVVPDSLEAQGEGTYLKVAGIPPRHRRVHEGTLPYVQYIPFRYRIGQGARTTQRKPCGANCGDAKVGSVVNGHLN